MIDEWKQKLQDFLLTIIQGTPVFENWLAFSGRRNRLSFLVCTIVWLTVAGILYLSGVNILDFSSIFSVVPGFPLLFVYFVLMAQRLRDFGCPVHIGIGVFLALAVLAVLSPSILYVVLVSINIVVIFWFPGTRGENDFGANPLSLAQDSALGAGVPVCEKWFTYSGRRNRRSFFRSVALLLVAPAIIFVVTMASGPIGIGTHLTVMIPFGFVFLVLAAQRLRDIGIPGWSVVSLVVLISLIFATEAILWGVIGIMVCLAAVVSLLFVRGTEGENKFGPDPLAVSVNP